MYRNVPGTYVSPWLKPSLDCIKGLFRYFHSGVRQLMPNLMQAMLINVHYTFPPPWAPRAESDSPRKPTSTNPDSCLRLTTSENRGWIPGIPTQSLLHEHTIQLWVKELWPIFHSMLNEVFLNALNHAPSITDCVKERYTENLRSSVKETE